MPAESLELLSLSPGKTAVDATLGGGGHAELMIEALSPGGRLIGLDMDAEAVAWSRRRLEPRAAAAGVALDVLQRNFAELGEVLDELGTSRVDALLADLGVSYHQLSTGERGFSFQVDAPLDMRMDATSPLTAADLVNRLPEKELADLIFRYGGEHKSRRVARAIVAERGRRGRIETTAELARVVARALRSPKGRYERGRIHPATRTFQALRIAVNRELESLEALLALLPERLSSGGRMVVISFHSLEDAQVKHFLREYSQRAETRLPTFRVLTSKPLRASSDEIAANPRARSAKLRAAERL